MTDLENTEVIEADDADEAQTEATTNRKRAPKRSKIADDYDPTPQRYPLSDEQDRPELSCWVDKSIAHPLSLGELSPLWRLPIDDMGTQDRKFRFLASQIVSVAGVYHVKDRRTGDWRPRQRSEVKAVILNDWGRDQTEFNIRADTVDEFLSGGELIVLDQTAFIPGASDFVSVNGRRALNTWGEPPMAFSVGSMNEPNFHNLLEMIALNLLGYDSFDPEKLLAEAHGEEATPFKWLSHWLACTYRRPGLALPTAVWFVGQAQGVGKGLFAEGMRTLVGRSNATLVSVAEFKGEWNDFIEGNVLLAADEVNFDSRRDLNDTLKRLIGNPLTTIRKRNRGASEIPTVANWLFTTNNTTPLALEQGDRRHTIFETRNSPASKARASAFYDLGPEGRSNAWQGFAEFLSSIDIDMVLISTGLDTPIKRRMTANNLDPVEEWFQSERLLEAWPLDTYASTTWLRGEYKAWAEANDVFPGCRSNAHFSRRFSDLISAGQISEEMRKTDQNGKRHRGYVRHDPNGSGSVVNIAEVEFAPGQPGVGRLTAQKLRNRLRAVA